MNYQIAKEVLVVLGQQVNNNYNKMERKSFNTFDRVLVRNMLVSKWRIAFFDSYDNTNRDFPFYTTCGYCRYCIPFEGNEDLVGTTNTPKSINQELPKHIKRVPNGQEYYYVHMDGDIGATKEEYSIIDDNMFRLGNYFKTREEAELAVERIRNALLTQD